MIISCVLKYKTKVLAEFNTQISLHIFIIIRNYTYNVIALLTDVATQYFNSLALFVKLPHEILRYKFEKQIAACTVLKMLHKRYM